MDAIAWFVGLSALIAGILALPYLITFINLCFVRLRPVQCRPIDDGHLPEGLMAAAQELRVKLESFGFQYRGAVANRSMLFDVERESFSLNFLHPEQNVLASLTETAFPGALRMFEVAFYSRLVNDRVLYTTDCHVHQMFRLPENYLSQDGYSGDLGQQWRLHSARLNLNPAAADAWSTEPFANSLEAISDWLQSCYDRFFDFWLQQRIIVRPAVKVYFPNPIYLLGFVPALIRGQKRALQTLQQTANQTASIDQRFLLERQLAFQRGGNPISKLLLLIISLAAFYVIFGFVFSWRLVPMLVVALFIHEYGHYLAMRMSGYRNTQIFFLPLLGAVTTGQKSDPTLKQELLVSLAGPVPGIVLGVALLLSPLTDIWPWLNEFALVCLVLNFINLLPLVPLDGGRVVEKLLFVRFAAARFIFYALSAAGFALAAWFTRDLILVFLAVFTGLLTKNEWRKRGLLRRIQASTPDFLQRSAAEKRELILSQVCAENLNASERFLFAKDLLATHSGTAPGIRAVLFGSVLYIALVAGASAGGIYALSEYGVNSVINSRDDSAYYSIDYWREMIDEEIKLEAENCGEHEPCKDFSWQTLLTAIQALHNGPNPEDAQVFIAEAEARLQNLREPDIHLAQWRLLKPDLTGVPLVDDDVAFIRRNIQNSEAASDTKGYALLRLLEARSLLDDAEKLTIVGEAIGELNATQDFSADTLANLYYRQGRLQKTQGSAAEAKASFAKGFEFELDSEFPLFSDSNYKQLLNLYFAAEQYDEGLRIAESRYTAMINSEMSEEDMHSSFMDDIRQQRAWFLLLTNAASASEEFATLLQNYEAHNQTGSEYRKVHLEYILDALYSHRLEGGDGAAYVEMLRQMPREHIEKFIRGCNCKNRGAFDAYRHEQYLMLLQDLDFDAPDP